MYRLQPNMPASAYKTFSVSSPLSTHWRSATCEEVGCLNHANGWVTKVLPGSDLEGTVRTSGRKWIKEERTQEGHIAFTFPAGQKCFAASTHRVLIGRPEIFTTRRGDWRADLGEHVTHTRAEFWLEEFAEHQQRLADAQKEG